MKHLYLSILSLFTLTSNAQTTHQVCISEVFSTGACNSSSGIFTPGNLTINQGDQIQFTTYLIGTLGYNGTHDIQFTGSPANNVLLTISTNVLAPVTTVTTPPFNTPGTFAMECVNGTHCTFAQTYEGWPCTGYSVTVLPNCPVTAEFAASDTNACTGDVINFTNNSTGASTYQWFLEGALFSTSTNAVLSFGSSGSYDIELVASDGSCNDTTALTINIDQAVDAGADDQVTFCNVNDSIDLNTLVTGNTGGSWQEITSSGQFNNVSGYFDYTDLVPANYEFEYVVFGSSSCPNDTAAFTVTVNQEPDLTLNLSTNNLDITDSIHIDFTPNGVLPGAQFLWNFCDGNLGTDTAAFYYSWGTTGNFCVCVDVNNGNNCTTTVCDSSITVYDASGINQLDYLDVKVYPNPAGELFTIDLSALQGEVEVRMYDAAQRLVMKQKTTGGSPLVVNSTDLENGTYFIHISTADKQTVVPLVVN